MPEANDYAAFLECGLDAFGKYNQKEAMGMK